MKVKIVAILTLVALSCQKEKMPEQQRAANVSAESFATQQLLADPNFVKLYQISLPIFNALKKGRKDLSELYNDYLVYPNECTTLAPKLGFRDSAGVANYFHQLNFLALKIAKAHPMMTLKQCRDAVADLNKTDMASNPCQDGVIGQFVMNVAECGALGLIPVIGEALAGTCMVGALIAYNAGMQGCAGGNQ